jgi:hypothetical protein
LETGTILFLDNGKCEFADYMEIYRAIRDEFERRNFGTLTYCSETVRGRGAGEFEALAAEYADEGYDAAIVGLGDKGTTAGTTIFTIELEHAGLPSVFVTSPPGSELAESIVALRNATVCLCPLDIYQASSD